MPTERVRKAVQALVSGPGTPEERLAAVCRLLRSSVPHYHWVGFYRADLVKRELTLGPYDGEPTEHLRIPFGRGICGQAAERRETFVIQDVAAQSNYLSCSPQVRSEIVLPIFKAGALVAELDIDSHQLASFTESDRDLLEQICILVADQF